MSKPDKEPRWATGGGAIVTEPSEGDKDSGWEYKEKPPSSWFNWLHLKAYQWIKFLYDEMLSPLITDAGVLKADTVGDSQVDWGTGVGQVSDADIPIEDDSEYFVGTTIEAALDELAEGKAIQDRVITARQAHTGANLIKNCSGEIGGISGGTTAYPYWFDDNLLDDTPPIWEAHNFENTNRGPFFFLSQSIGAGLSVDDCSIAYLINENTQINIQAEGIAPGDAYVILDIYAYENLAGTGTPTFLDRITWTVADFGFAKKSLGITVPDQTPDLVSYRIFRILKNNGASPGIVTGYLRNIMIAGGASAEEPQSPRIFQFPPPVVADVDNSSLEISPGGIAQIKDDGVTGAKLASAVAGSGIVQDGSGNLDVNVDGSTIEVATDVVQIKDEGVTAVKIETDGVTAAKINPDVAGDGLVPNGTTGALDINADDSTIEVASDVLQIKDGGVTPSKFNVQGSENYHFETAKTLKYTLGAGDFTRSAESTALIFTGTSEYIQCNNADSSDRRAFALIHLPKGANIKKAYMGYSRTAASGAITEIKFSEIVKTTPPTAPTASILFTLISDTDGYDIVNNETLDIDILDSAWYTVSLRLNNQGTGNAAKFYYLEIEYEMTNLLPVG